MVAPFSAYASSVKPADNPAFDSTSTWWPAFTSTAALTGTSATRRSPGHDSLTTPMIMITSRSEDYVACSLYERCTSAGPRGRGCLCTYYKISARFVRTFAPRRSGTWEDRSWELEGDRAPYSGDDVRGGD